MSRRILALLAALALLCTGCGKQEAASSVSSSAGSFGSIPEDEDCTATLTAQVISAPGTFAMPYNSSYGWDPYACTSMENRAVMQLIYEGLFLLNNDFDAEPVLCKDYTVSDDGLTYTLNLQDATFSSGDTLDVEDVMYSYEKAAASELYGSRFQDISYLEADGLSTLIIHLTTPNDRLPCLLDFPIIPNLSSTSAPVGTGPFVRDTGTSLTKNRSWWQGADKVQFDTITLYSSSSAEDTRDSFEIDQVHFVYNDPVSASAAQFHCDYELWNSKGTVMQYIGFNLQSGIFQDKAVRRAVLRAIDRSDIAESVYHNFADAAALPVAPTSSMYDDSLALDYSYNVSEALSLLLESGSFYLPENSPLRDKVSASETEVQEEPEDQTEAEEASEDLEDQETDDAEEADVEDDMEDDTEDDTEADEEDDTSYNSITMLVLSGNLYRATAAKQAADCLTAVGFTVTLKSLDEEEFYYTLNNGEYDLYYADVALTPDFDLRSLLYSDGGLNYGHIPEDSTLTSLYQSALENSGNRYDLYEYIMDQAYICPVLFQNHAVFTTRGVFTGLSPTPDSLFYNIENIEVQ
jgi:peptide/nickel transport system substrate-binding protein